MAPGTDLCLNHDERDDKGRSERALAAVRAKRIKARPSRDLMSAVVVLTDRVSIQATIDVAMRLYLDSRIDDRKFRNLIQACSTAVRNFDAAGETLAGPRPQTHDFMTYFSRVRSLLQSVDPMIATYDVVEASDE